MSKHTQGPWTYKIVPNGLIEIRGVKLPIASLDLGQCDPNYTELDLLADARLIAAAPELLEIAKAYRNLLRVSASTEGQVATFQHIEKILTNVEGNDK